MPEQITLTDPIENTEFDCDLALGDFIRSWDQLEHQIGDLIQIFLDTHTKGAYAVMNCGIDHHKLRDLLTALSETRLKDTDKTKFARLMDRWKKFSTKRNRIIHGTWQLSVEITDELNQQGIKRTKARWRRLRPPSNINELSHIAKKKKTKIQSAYVFELDEIYQVGKDVRKFAKDIDAFLKKTKIMPFPDSLPVEFQQHTGGTDQKAQAESGNRHPKSQKGIQPLDSSKRRQR